MRASLTISALNMCMSVIIDQCGIGQRGPTTVTVGRKGSPFLVVIEGLASHKLGLKVGNLVSLCRMAIIQVSLVHIEFQA